MACDPACHATDMSVHLIPPILRSNVIEHKRRIDNNTCSEEEMFKVARIDLDKDTKKNDLHHMSNLNTKENTSLQDEVGVQCLFAVLASKHMNLPIWFVDNKDNNFVYVYHQTVLQALHEIGLPRS